MYSSSTLKVTSACLSIIETRFSTNFKRSAVTYNCLHCPLLFFVRNFSSRHLTRQSRQFPNKFIKQYKRDTLLTLADKFLSGKKISVKINYLAQNTQAHKTRRHFHIGKQSALSTQNYTVYRFQRKKLTQRKIKFNARLHTYMHT